MRMAARCRSRIVVLRMSPHFGRIRRDDGRLAALPRGEGFVDGRASRLSAGSTRHGIPPSTRQAHRCRTAPCWHARHLGVAVPRRARRETGVQRCDAEGTPHCVYDGQNARLCRRVVLDASNGQTNERVVYLLLVLERSALPSKDVADVAQAAVPLAEVSRPADLYETIPGPDRIDHWAERGEQRAKRWLPRRTSNQFPERSGDWDRVYGTLAHIDSYPSRSSPRPVRAGAGAQEYPEPLLGRG